MPAEDKKPAPPRAAASGPDTAPLSSAVDKELRISVALVRFDRPLQYPGKGSDDHAKSETLNNGKTWLVEYLPAMRHFRIAYSDPGRNERKVGYVHEMRSLGWEPML